MQRCLVLTLLLVTGCATKRAAYGGMAAGAGVALVGAYVIQSAYDGNQAPCTGDCIGSSRALIGIGIVLAGLGLVGVAGTEAARLQPPSAADRAAILGARAQQHARARDCPLVEALGAEVRALENGESLYEEFVRLPNVSGCLQRLERMRNQAAAWELTKRAAAQARGGDCAAVARSGPEVIELDRSFHDIVFLGDVAIFACLQFAVQQATGPGVETHPAAHDPARGLQALTTTAVHRARSGDCDTVRAIAARVRELDATYYSSVFMTSTGVEGCVSPPRP